MDGVIIAMNYGTGSENWLADRNKDSSGPNKHGKGNVRHHMGRQMGKEMRM